MSILHPYMIEVYVARDGSETCLLPNPPKAFCAQNEAVKEVKLELEFKRYETYEDKTREPQGTVGVYHGGEGVREDTLTSFPPLFYIKVDVLNCVVAVRRITGAFLGFSTEEYNR
jgi:hypothetical protein